MDDERRVAYRTCPLCEATCGLEITLDGDEVVRIRGDRDDVFSYGFICPKGSTLKQLEADPDRLRAPQMKADGTWKTVSWDEAFAEVDRRLMAIIETHGRDAVGLFLGNPNVHTMAGGLYLKPFARALGSRNVFSASTVDQMPKHVSSALLFGHPQSIPVPDLDRTDYLLMLGADPWESNGSLATAPDFPGRLHAIQERGGRFVVVDPRRSRTAQEADEHLFIRPGTDALWLMAIINELFAEGLVSLGHLDGAISGLDDVALTADPYTPEAVAGITGIPATTTRRITAELAAAPTAVVYGRMGTTTVEFGTVGSWAVDVLNVLTGNLDRPGGAMLPLAAHSRRRSGPGGRGFQLGRWTSRVRELPEVWGELPAATLADEITTEGPGQIRAMVTVAGNPVSSTPNTGRLDEAMAGLEFMVSVDLYRNETTRHADVILPPPTPLTRGHYDFAFYNLSVHNVANYSPPVLPMPSEAMDEWQILAKLGAIVMGYGPTVEPAVVDDQLIRMDIERETGRSGSAIEGRSVDEVMAALEPATGPERWLDFKLRTGPYGEGFGADPDGLSLAKLEAHPHGIDLGPLTPALPEILTTPSGTIELAPEPLRGEFARLADALGRTGNGSMTLVGRRQLRSNNSWMHNLEVLVKGKERCTLQVHPDDAGRLKIADGEQARVTSRVGSVEAPVEVTADVMPGVVSLPHGWGHDLEGMQMAVAAQRPGVNSNRLADHEAVDPLSGTAVLNGIPVTVEPA